VTDTTEESLTASRLRLCGFSAADAARIARRLDAPDDAPPIGAAWTKAQVVGGPRTHKPRSKRSTK
jgi:hypothetical protein